MKLPVLKIAAVLIAIAPTAAYANAYAAGEGVINWGTGRQTARSSMNFCEADFGPVPHLMPCWAGRFTMGY